MPKKDGAKSKQTCAAIVSPLLSSSFPRFSLFMSRQKAPIFTGQIFRIFVLFYFFYLLFLRQSPRKRILTLPRFKIINEKSVFILEMRLYTAAFPRRKDLSTRNPFLYWKRVFTLPHSPALHPRPVSEACAFPLSLQSFCKSASLWLPGSSLCPSGPSIRCSTPGTLSRTSPSGTGP